MILLIRTAPMLVLMSFFRPDHLISSRSHTENKQHSFVVFSIYTIFKYQTFHQTALLFFNFIIVM